MLGAGNIKLTHSQSSEPLLKNCDSSFEIYLLLQILTDSGGKGSGEKSLVSKPRPGEWQRMPITHSWGVLSSCPGLSLADPQELAQTSGKGKADITTPPRLCQVVKPKETSINLPIASSEGLLALLFGLWSKGLQPERQVGKRKLLLLSSTGLAASCARQTIRPVTCAHVTACWLHL